MGLLKRLIRSLFICIHIYMGGREGARRRKALKDSQSFPKASQRLPKDPSNVSQSSPKPPKPPPKAPPESPRVSQSLPKDPGGKSRIRHATLLGKIDIGMPQTMYFTIVAFLKPCILRWLSQ